MRRWSRRKLLGTWHCRRYAKDPRYWLAVVAYVALGMVTWFTQWLFVLATFFALVGGVRVLVRGLEIRSEGWTRLLSALLVVPLFLVHEGASYLMGILDRKYPRSEE